MRSLGFLVVVLALLSASQVSAQPVPPTEGLPRIGPVRAYVELLGNGGLGSLNVEAQVTPALAFRAGVGYVPGYNSLPESVTVPVVLLHVPRSGGGVEVGGGVTGFYRPSPDELRVARTSYAATAVVGYRWTTREGLLLRAAFTPTVGELYGTSGLDVAPLVGFSVGGDF